MTFDQRGIRFRFQTRMDESPSDCRKQFDKQHGGAGRVPEIVTFGYECDGGMEEMTRLISKAESEIEGIMDILGRIHSIIRK